MTVAVKNGDIGTEVQEGANQVKEVAKQAVGQVQQKAQELAGQAQEQAKSAVTTRKDQAVEELGHVAQAFRATSDELRQHDKGSIAHYADKVADQVDRVSGYLEERDVNQLLEDTENFARRQPELFIGGALIIGLLVGRFIKSSSERRGLARREQSGGSYQAYQGNYPYAEPARFAPTGPTGLQPSYNMPTSIPAKKTP